MSKKEKPTYIYVSTDKGMKKIRAGQAGAYKYKSQDDNRNDDWDDDNYTDDDSDWEN